MKTLSHFDSNGHAAQVNVSGKSVSRRQATAYGEIHARARVIKALLKKQLTKGDALTTAKIAGIFGAKRTAELIPLCHGLNLDWADVTFKIFPEKIAVTAAAHACGKTGVEMEALTAVSLACLTLYDMCKSLDKTIVIGPIYLVEKKGGKSGVYRRRNHAN